MFLSLFGIKYHIRKGARDTVNQFPHHSQKQDRIEFDARDVAESNQYNGKWWIE